MSKPKTPNPKKLSFEQFQCRRNAPTENKKYIRIFQDLLLCPAFEELDPYCVFIYLDMLKKFQYKDNFIYSFDSSKTKFSRTIFFRSIKTLVILGFISYVEYNRFNRKAHIYKFHHAWQDSFTST
jgi:hypothetical protein